MTQSITNVSLTTRRVLVVDDSEDTVESTATVLRLQGHEVRTALSGPEALEAAVAFQPEVVFVDLAMPGMDGFEVARRLRTQVAADKPLLVAVTGYSGEADRRRSQSAGFDMYLVKPAEPELFARLLRTGGTAPPAC